MGRRGFIGKARRFRRPAPGKDLPLDLLQLPLEPLDALFRAWRLALSDRGGCWEKCGCCERRQWQKFKKLGRPKVGKGAKTISLTVEPTLLQRADDYANQPGLTRATLVAQGLEAILGSAA